MSAHSPDALRAVVVGTGFGLRVHVPALRASGVDVVGLVGQDAERTGRRAERVGIPGAYVSLHDALEGSAADIVTIASPPDSHRDLAVEALEKGLHVICEKPLATSTLEADDMCAAARRAGRVAYVGHEFRYAAANALVARLIAEGVIGEPRLATIVRMYSLLARPDAAAPDWWFRPSAGGGWLNGNGSHAVDIIRTQLGEITSVTASLYSVHERSGGGEDSFSALFTTDRGVRGVFQESAAVWGDPLQIWQIGGTAGTLSVSDDVVRLADESGDRVIPPPPSLVPDTGVELDGANNRPWTLEEILSYQRLIADFCREIRGEAVSSEAPRPPTFEDGRKSVQVLDAMRRSARTGETTQLPLEG